MEPLTASSALAVLRPAGAAMQAELSAVLRDGRVLTGEVLQAGGDGSVLLALGRHRVPAETRLALEPGQQFLLRVSVERGEVVLHLLGAGDPQEGALLAALRRVVADGRPIGELLTGLAARLRAELAAGTGGTAAEALARAAGEAGFRPGTDGQGLRALLLATGLAHEAALAAGAREGMTPEAWERLRTDLKAELLRALERMEEGPLREATARALRGLEAEQLLNVARQRAGEAFVWSLPVPDGEAFATARLFVLPSTDEEADGGSGDSEGAAPRVVLEVELSNLGAIRAELALEPDALSVRVYAEQSELVGLLQGRFAELAERLGDGRRAVRLFSRVATPAELDGGERPLDIRFLRENHLMDVRG